MISYINNNPTLTISQACTQDGWAAIRKITDAWSSFTEQVKTRPNLDEDEKERLSDCGLVCHRLNSLASDLPTKDPIEILVCTDERERFQAMMSIWTDASSVDVMHIVSNPENLIPENVRTPEDPQPTRGSAKALMEWAIARAAGCKVPVELSAYRLAVGFYEKMGFERDSTKTSRMTTPMILTLEKIISLYPDLANNRKAS